MTPQRNSIFYFNKFNVTMRKKNPKTYLLHYYFFITNWNVTTKFNFFLEKIFTLLQKHMWKCKLLRLNYLFVDSDAPGLRLLRQQG